MIRVTVNQESALWAVVTVHDENDNEVASIVLEDRLAAYTPGIGVELWRNEEIRVGDPHLIKLEVS